MHETYSWGGVKLSTAPTVREVSIAPSPQRAEHFYLLSSQLYSWNDRDSTIGIVRPELYGRIVRPELKGEEET